MSYSPLTGLVYFPAQEQWTVQARVADGQFQLRALPLQHRPALRQPSPSCAANCRRSPTAARRATCWPGIRCTQKEAFRIPYPYPGSGGVLTTAGNLLVQGTINRTLAIYSATDGSKLWEMPTQTVPIAGPMTYSRRWRAVHRRQCRLGRLAGASESTRRSRPCSSGRRACWCFKLDAKGVAAAADAATVRCSATAASACQRGRDPRGQKIFGETCSRCHGENAVRRREGPALHGAGDARASSMPSCWTARARKKAWWASRTS